jgi:hypothetical protein
LSFPLNKESSHTGIRTLESEEIIHHPQLGAMIQRRLTYGDLPKKLNAQSIYFPGITF